MAKKTTFTLAANIAGDAESGILVGEFNNWDESNGIELKKQKDGSFKADVSLEPGTYHYRYFLSDGRWVNDGNADHYAPVHGLHVDNCVITVADEPAPKAEKAAPKAKAAAKTEKSEEAPKAAAKPKKAAAPKEEAAKPAPKAKAEPKPKAEKAPAKSKTKK